MPADGQSPLAALSGRDTWVFDLDNTLYPAECDLFAEIDQRMTDFVAQYLRLDRETARATQKKYYAEHGTTLNGLMTVNGMEPGNFLAHVHEIDLSPLPRSAALVDAISTLPGKKYVYTNGSRRHADRVTEYMGLNHLFDGRFGIEDSAYTPKPAQTSYDAFCKRFGIAPQKAVFFEDLSRNLVPAHKMGFATVLVQSNKDWSHEPEAARPAGIGDDQGEHIDYVTGNLTQFLQSLTN